MWPSWMYLTVITLYSFCEALLSSSVGSYVALVAWKFCQSHDNNRSVPLGYEQICQLCSSCVEVHMVQTRFMWGDVLSQGQVAG